MKKSEILKVFGDRVVSYHRIGSCDILVVNVTGLIWEDFNAKLIAKIINIQPWDSLSVRVSFECNIWD